MAEFHRFPTPTIPDADLARAAAEGDPKAAPVIFDRYASLVRGMLRRNLGPTADVDDLVQEVFLRYFRAPGALRDGAALKSFLIGVTLRVAGSALRKKRVRRWFTFTDQVPEVEGPSTSDPEARAALQKLYSFLDDLDDRSRTAFTLRFFEGYELTEVAEAMGLSLATVKRSLAKAQEKVHARVSREPLLAKYLAESQVKVEVQDGARRAP